MNGFHGFTKATKRGFLAMLRTAGDGEPKPILTRGGEPIYYAVELDAMRAIIEHLCRYMNGNLVRIGEIAGETAAAAESVFKPQKIVKQRGRTRVIAVTYTRGAEKCAPELKREKRPVEQPDIPIAPFTSPGFSG